MSRIVTLLLLCFTLLGCAGSTALQTSAGQYVAPAGAIVLRVEVLEVEFTDLAPGCGDADCIPFDFWYKYRARVKEVISGDWDQPVVEFTNLQHAEFIDSVTHDCYVVLRPAGKELQSKVGVPFAADKLLSRFWKPDRAVIKALRMAPNNSFKPKPLRGSA